MENLYKECTVCERRCRINRESAKGFCSSPCRATVVRAGRHMWEEPCISGERGSGTVFFSGCNLKCVYCQNSDISRDCTGYELSTAELRRLVLIINESDCHNINLVTPTHYLPSIAQAIAPIKSKLDKPVVYNCSGYENVELLEECKDIIDIFLTDIKYKSNILSKKYSSCENYFDIASRCLKKMVEITGSPRIENGLMTRGTVVRHLILPGCKSDSIEILSYLKENFDTSDFLISLMGQYTPNEDCTKYPEINRRLTKLEYKRVCEAFEKSGFQGYVQELSSASTEYIPPFSEKGEFLEILFS